MKLNKKNNLLPIVFILIGISLFIIGILVCKNTFNYEDKIDTKGTITEIIVDYDSDGDANYDVYVSYIINGEEYESKLNSYSSSFYEGKIIDIYYDKNNPRKIGNKDLDKITIIIPIFGVIFLSIGLMVLIIPKIKNSKHKTIKQNGKRIEASYIETVINTSYSFNNMNPYNIVCQWYDEYEGEYYIFESENIWSDPQDIIEKYNIVTIPVYIDVNNKKNYYVDIEDIMKQLNEVNYTIKRY